MITAGLMPRSVIRRCGALPLLRPRSLIIDSIKMAVKLDVAHQPRSVLFVLEGRALSHRRNYWVFEKITDELKWQQPARGCHPLVSFFLFTSFIKKTRNQNRATVHIEDKLASPWWLLTKWKTSQRPSTTACDIWLHRRTQCRCTNRQGTEGTDSDRAMEDTRTLLLLHQRLKKKINR